jgi:predicted nucleic acid-binding protein
VIAYLDASALVKRYIVERGSRETIALTGESEVTATSIVSRADVVAALAKAARTGVVTQELARNARRLFIGDWPDLARVPMTGTRRNAQDSKRGRQNAQAGQRRSNSLQMKRTTPTEIG